MAVEIIGSNPIVEEHVPLQQSAIELLKASGLITEINAIALGVHVRGADDELALDPSVSPYSKMLGSLSTKVGVVYNPVVCATPDEMADAVRKHSGRPTIVMSDERVRDDLDDILEGLLPQDDIDGMTEEGREVCHPATGLSVVDYADWAVSLNNRDRSEGRYTTGLEMIDPERIAVVGGTSRLVGIPAIERMWDMWRIKPSILINEHNSDEILPKLHKIADVVISCTGVPGLIEAPHIIREKRFRKIPMIVIDAGVAPHPKLGPEYVYGDVHPTVYGYKGRDKLRVSPAPVIQGGERLKLGPGVGKLTVRHLINNAIFVTELKRRRMDRIPVLAH